MHKWAVLQPADMNPPDEYYEAYPYPDKSMILYVLNKGNFEGWTWRKRGKVVEFYAKEPLIKNPLPPDPKNPEDIRDLITIFMQTGHLPKDKTEAEKQALTEAVAKLIMEDLETEKKKTRRKTKARAIQQAINEKCDPEVKIIEVPPIQVGKKTPIFVRHGLQMKEYPATWKLYEVSDLLTSFDEGYPQQLQPRQRFQEDIKRLLFTLEKLNPKALIEITGTPVEGPPVVAKVEGINKPVVISGNGRVYMLRILCNLGKGLYYDELRKRFPKETRKFKCPVLVRELTEKFDLLKMHELEKIAYASNTGSQDSMNLIEMAKYYAENIKPVLGETIEDFKTRVWNEIHTQDRKIFMFQDSVNEALLDYFTRLILLFQYFEDPDLIFRIVAGKPSRAFTSAILSTIYDFMKAKVEGGENYDLYKALANEIWLLIKEKTPETEEGKTIYNLLHSPRKLRQFLEELAQKHQALAYRFRHVPLFPNPDDPYNFNMQNSDPILQALQGINNTLQQMNRQLKKLDKLDDIAKYTKLSYRVLTTTKAEITEKGLLDAFRVYLEERDYSTRVIDAEIYEENKEDFVIIAEIIATNGNKQEVVFSFEATNYLDIGNILKRKIELLTERAKKRGSVPVLGARFMTREAINYAKSKGVNVFTYDPQERAFKLL